MSPAEEPSAQCPFPQALCEQPEALEPGMQWVAMAPHVPWEQLPLVGIAVDALGRPNLVLHAENFQDSELVALLDAVATVRREGPPLAGTFLRAHELRVTIVSTSPEQSMRRRLQVLAEAFPLAWWQWEEQKDTLIPLRLLPTENHEHWSGVLPAATAGALQRLLQGSGRLRPPIELIDAGGTLLLRHLGLPILALFREGDQILALAQGEGQEVRRIDEPFVVDHLLDGLLSRLLDQEERVPQSV